MSMTSEEIKRKLDELSASLSKEDRFEVEAKVLIAQYVHAILSIMDSNDLNRKTLAKKIGTSASYITQLFRGKKLINFITLAKIQDALNIQFQVSLKSQLGEYSELTIPDDKLDIVPGYVHGEANYEIDTSITNEAEVDRMLEVA